MSNISSCKQIMRSLACKHITNIMFADHVRSLFGRFVFTERKRSHGENNVNKDL